MKKYFCVIPFLVWSHFGFAIEDFSIVILNPPQQIKPGDYFTLFVEIKRDEPYDPTFGTTFNLPKDWQVLAKKLPQITNQSRVLSYSYTVATPRTTSAGEYVVLFRTWEKGFEKESKEIKIRVEKLRKIEITTLVYPEYVKEGETLKIEYLIQNLGNEKEKIELKSSRGQIEGHKSSLLLEKNESVRVWVHQSIPYTESNMWIVNSDLKVSFGDTSRPVYQVKSIPVYAAKNKKSDPYLRFPVEVGVLYHTFRSVNQQREGFQYDIRGGGNLDFSQKHYLDFVARSQNQFGYAAIGSYEQYSLNYSYKPSARQHTDLALADYSLVFTNLIELSRFGRGFKVDHSVGRSTVSGFYQEPRFFPDTKKIMGGAYVFNPTPKSAIGVNFLSKQHVYNGQNLETNFLGLSTYIKKERIWLEAEATGSQTNDRFDWGAFGRLSFSTQRLRFFSNVVYAGQQFYGFYNDSRLLNASLYYAITKKLTLGAIGNYNQINPSLDVTVFSQAPYYKSNIAELTLRPNTRNRFVLSYNELHREDRVMPQKFNFKEEFIRYTHFLNTRRFNLWMDGNYGYTHNLLVSPDKDSSRVSIKGMIQAQVVILKVFALGGNVEYLRTNRYSMQNELQDFMFYGGTLRLQFKKYFDLSLLYRNNYTIDELTEKRSFFDLQANLNLPHHQLSIVGSQAYYPNITEQNTLYLGIKYTLKLRPPIAKNTKLGSLKGKITGPANVRKNGVILQIGDQKLVSDRNGQFAINNLLPNKYYITLVRSSMQIGDIPAIATPLEIEIKSDSSYYVDIPFSKAGIVMGKVMFEKSTQTRTKELLTNKPTILAKLYNDTESYVTKVSDKDTFTFKEVKPGPWKVMIWIPGHGEKYKIDNVVSDVEVTEEASHELFFKVKPIERKIHFTENNFYLGAKE